MCWYLCCHKKKKTLLSASFRLHNSWHGNDTLDSPSLPDKHHFWALPRATFPCTDDSYPVMDIMDIFCHPFSAFLALQWIMAGKEDLSFWSSQGMLGYSRIFLAGDSPAKATPYMACFSSSSLNIWQNLWCVPIKCMVKKWKKIFLKTIFSQF